MRGVVHSLLVTDIVGSTRLWAEHESAMEIDLRLHDDLVNALITEAGGRIFKHTGDGCMATFQDAAASAVAAASIQRSIATQNWEVPGGLGVRVALHSGSVHERGGDLFGPPVNRLARLLARCTSGAVLVSEATAALLVDGMPPGLQLRQLGFVELRDLAHAEAVHCLVGDALVRVDAAEVIGPAARLGSLPNIDDDLVGRTGEVAAALDAIKTHALVSIVGVGGMGKTRLALEAATALDLPDGTWWFDLTTATSPDAVPAAALAAIAGRQSQGRSTAESVVDHLARQRTLVVFDNCEHVIDAACELIAAIRAGCPHVRVLATSREAIGLRGEHVISLSSLPSDDAVGLFCTRAGEARADLQLDDATLATIEEICTRLDGIPLAIELAAARCRSMAPAEIAERLDDRFRLLRGGRGAAERHRTLQATVAWSYSLLDDEERSLFDTMAVFAGGALIDAVAAVADVDEYDALDILDRLVARSMIVATDTELGTRYRQLETLRQYAEDRLVEAGNADATRLRHLDWVRVFAASCDEAHLTSAEISSFRRYVAELDNIRAAVRYAVDMEHEQEACEVIAGISVNAFFRPTFEVAEWLDTLRIPPGDWTDAIATTAGVSAALAFFAGDQSRCVALRLIVPPAHFYNQWIVLAATYETVWVAGDYDAAEARLAEAASTNLSNAHTLAVYQSHVFQQRIHGDRANDQVYIRNALAHCERIISEARQLDAAQSIAGALLMYGQCLEGTGEFAAAIAAQTEVIELTEAAGSWFVVDAARGCLVDAVTQLAVNDPDQRHDAVVLLRTTLDAAVKRRNHFLVTIDLMRATKRVLWTTGDHRTAALLAEFSRLQFHGIPRLGAARDDTMLDDATTVEIKAEAAVLDIDSAGAIALAALDRILAS